MRFTRPTARLDLVGVALLGATAAWFTLTSAGRIDESLPATAVLLAAAMGVLMARASAEWLYRPLPAAIVVVVAGAGLLGSDKYSEPLGYANANGIFFALAAFAAFSLWIGASDRPAGMVAGLAALGFAAATVLTRSFAASALLALAPLVIVAARFGAGRWAVLGCAVAFLVVLGATVALGVTYSGADTPVSSALSGRRLALWHDALVITKRYPVEGAGFGRFQQLSPTARSDRDARWAHNEFLQLAAETGIPGLALVASLFLWGFARLAAEPLSPQRAIAAAALAAVGIHASVDYVLHFAAVPLAAAILMGAGLASARVPEGRSVPA